MGIFSRLLPSREERLTKEIIAKVRQEQQPISDLGAAIASAAMRCGEAMKPHVHFGSEEKNTEQAIYVCFEFLYFFMHMTDRIAYSQLGSDRRSKLMEALDPLIVGPAIDAFFDHWPEDRKAGMRSEFRRKLNIAQREYSACRGLVSDVNPVTGDSLFSTLARHVAELCGKSLTDPTAHVVPYGIAIEAWKQLQLDKHIEAVGKVL